ncbi:class E sortase [Nocardioides sp. BP30]|uniref:sortase n=1 Tax=Nocardioides sp. BP30 TaxID=3036374 RepID=UPI0024693BEA|nr:class E sortase [Nocardioides sp. BP30]WGL51831.1 class E sortase [Nocardioides sp. BP30]
MSTTTPARTTVREGAVDATPLERADTRRLRIGVGQAILLLAGLLGWLLLYVYVLSGFSQGHAQQQLYGQLRQELAEGTAPTVAPIEAGAPVALLDAPALGLHHLVVVEGTRPAQLQDGPGHQLGTVLPGQVGNSVLLGRAVSYGGPFRHLASLKPGAAITVTTAQGVFHYRVDDVRRNGDLLAPLADGASRLTLASAAGSAPLAHSETVYADASLVGAPQPASAVSATDPGGSAMARDASAGTLALLALALELLVGGLVAITWARYRWSRLAAWIAGLPVLLASLWLASMVATRLLPNLL